MKIAQIAACLFTLGLTSAAVAQNSPSKGAATAGAGDSAEYKEKTVYDFDDDIVEGDLQKPDGDPTTSMGLVEHESLIEIRSDFIPEMLKSLEDI